MFNTMNQEDNPIFRVLWFFRARQPIFIYYWYKIDCKLRSNTSITPPNKIK